MTTERTQWPTQVWLPSGERVDILNWLPVNLSETDEALEETIYVPILSLEFNTIDNIQWILSNLYGERLEEFQNREGEIGGNKTMGAIENLFAGSIYSSILIDLQGKGITQKELDISPQMQQAVIDFAHQEAVPAVPGEFRNRAEAMENILSKRFAEIPPMAQRIRFPHEITEQTPLLDTDILISDKTVAERLGAQQWIPLEEWETTGAPIAETEQKRLEKLRSEGIETPNPFEAGRWAGASALGGLVGQTFTQITPRGRAGITTGLHLGEERITRGERLRRLGAAAGMPEAFWKPGGGAEEKLTVKADTLEPIGEGGGLSLQEQQKREKERQEDEWRKLTQRARRQTQI